jgi:GNAT superfamily N-acetyltransferase
MAITFERADAARDRALLVAMNVQYFEWMEQNIRRDFGLEVTDLIGGPIAGYVTSTIDKLCAAEPPEGVFYVARRDGRPAGMGGVRRLADGASEMKRVFVPPEARGGGLGAAIVTRLISDAQAFGYTTMRLDSGPFMGSAHRLYEAEGFRDRPAYDGAEVPVDLRHNWRFMERALGPFAAVG